MKGLYFYKLVSPYSEDVTKDCKLSVNEIDHNFITLKDADIKNAHFNADETTLVLERNDGDIIDVDLSSMVDGITKNLDVDYDSVAGTITVTYNGKRAVIDGLITKDNVSKDVLAVTDGTLSGKGNSGDPMGISPVERTGTYKPAIRLINIANGECMPKPHHLIRGDRYVTFENVSDYGYLYDFRSTKRINEDLNNGWRIPSKSDWDNMLNAIEPCDEYRNHNSIIGNQVLGKIAGKLLKSSCKWDIIESYVSDCGTPSCNNTLDNDDALVFDEDDCNCGCPGSPKPPKPVRPKRITPNGVDSYGMRLLPAGYGDGCQVMDYFGKRGAFWSSTMSHVTDVYIKRFDYNKAGVVQSVESPNALFSIRLVKDFDGSNHQDAEYINGVNYSTKLLPSLNCEHGHSIWTSTNASFTNEKYRPIEPNGGMGLTFKKTYYINEWTGFDWVKKEMNEGDSIVLLNGLECHDKNIEYRIDKGTLVGVDEIVYANIMIKIQPEIDRIDGELYDVRDRVTNTEERVTTLEACTTKINEKLTQEIEDRVEGDTQLWDGLNEEITNREHINSEHWTAINNEAAVREQTDTQLWEVINEEKDIREDVDRQLWTAINNEGVIRERVDNEQWDSIVNEGVIRERVDNEQWVAINAERTAREEGDAKLEVLINKTVQEHENDFTELKELIKTEVAIREADDAKLWEGIVAEGTARQADDAKLWEGIVAEGTARQEEDIKIKETLTNEIAIREDVDKQLWTAINNEGVVREDVDTQLWTAINNEGVVREDVDRQLWEGIATETAAREDVDRQLWVSILAETTAREDVDKQLWEAINNEGVVREETDTQLWTAINNEGVVREETDTQLWGGLNAEIARATAKEQYLDDRVITEEGSSYNCSNGTLTLETKKPENKITIKLTGNYGTF